MFEAVEARATSGAPTAVRNLAILELLYGSGLRATELVSLARGALRKGQPFLILRGKGGKERLVPISSRAETAVETWLAHVPRGLVLFRREATSAAFGCSDRADIARSPVFRPTCKAAVLRHAFATHLLSGEPTFACFSRCLARRHCHPLKSTPIRQRATGRTGHARHPLPTARVAARRVRPTRRGQC